MTKPDFTLHRERLLALRARLQGDMTQMEDNALNKNHSKTTSMPTSLAELGSDNFDQELTLSLLGSDKDALNQIDAAIKRIDDGSYGRCETCDGKLSKARLEAIPYAAQCVRCASQQEEGRGGLNHGAVPATRGQRTNEDANGDV
jgi:DnaK suppressor protein